MLASAGLEVELFSDAAPERTTSVAACAVWLPLYLAAGAGDGSTVPPSDLRRWVADSYAAFRSLTSAAAGVSEMPLYRLGQSENDAPDVAGVVPSLTHRVADELPPEMRHIWSYDSFAIDMQVYLSWLSGEIKELGVRAQVGRKYRTIDEAIADTGAQVLVNCTGAGAAALCGDRQLRGAKGVLLFKDPLPVTGILSCREFILAPRERELVAGSLYDLDYSSEQVEPHDVARLEEWHAGWPAEALELVGITPADMWSARTRGAISGIRPVRPVGARFELEHHDGCTIIHNYGHGGAGVTVSWGAAHAVKTAALEAGCR